ncbi:MAG: lamin tail domain-containing protein [Candidatus Wildermuthbacteria bacterium]|nr:lamin tail domain-containing protein [Candidatus Wildermuthbacteria bacterium]
MVYGIKRVKRAKKGLAGLLLFFLLFPFVVWAQMGNVAVNEIVLPAGVAGTAQGLYGDAVIINEIAWMGSFAPGVDAKQGWRYEWLELYNAGAKEQSLEGWDIELIQGEKIMFSISLSGVIGSNGFYLVGASKKIPDIDISYENLAGKFANSGMEVALKDGSGLVVDAVDALKGWPAGDNETKRTMERKSVVGSDPTTQGGWITSENPGGTPKAKNSAGFKDNSAAGKSERETEAGFGVGNVFQNKKDASQASFLNFSTIKSSPILPALSLALVFCLALVFLRRRLARQATRRIGV